MSKEKAGRNRTIDTSIREGKEYLDRCISIKEKQSDLHTGIGIKKRRQKRS